ncbi:MAG TPA: diaminopimelate decarboxylase, partial [Firmicutes bacterium]|nr:diaminopimelate decarboxylase [Bacillota bacterium]
FTVPNGDLFECLDAFEHYTCLKLVGLHAHIGSQIFEVEPYLDEVEIMMHLVKEIREEYGIHITDVDLGGGIGVYYTEKDQPKTTQQFCEAILEQTERICAELEIEIPTLMIEPGRSIVANAGSTLYTVGSMKDIKDVRTYVSVDGGMTDNIRPSLYQARYECAIANHMQSGTEKQVTIAGKCCESGDILITDVDVLEIKPGDLLLVASTGAYGYSMSSNYNKIPKAAVVAVSNGQSQLVCKRQSYDELLALEV